MTENQHQHHSEAGRAARHDQANLYSYLREQSRRASIVRQQQIANLSAKHIERHLHRRMPASGHGRA